MYRGALVEVRVIVEEFNTKFGHPFLKHILPLFTDKITLQACLYSKCDVPTVYSYICKRSLWFFWHFLQFSLILTIFFKKKYKPTCLGSKIDHSLQINILTCLYTVWSPYSLLLHIFWHFLSYFVNFDNFFIKKCMPMLCLGCRIF